ncbi:MAG TPA: hypothetical protein VIT66_13175 [Lysobacter sp.]
MKVIHAKQHEEAIAHNPIAREQEFRSCVSCLMGTALSTEPG